MLDPNFWGDQAKAKVVIEEVNALKGWTVPYSELKARLNDSIDLIPEAKELGDEDLTLEILQELKDINERVEALELKKMLSGELDQKDCFLEINAGAGGTESCDWVQMLSRMYQRWALSRGWKVETVDCLDGEVAGIKSITLKFSGDFAYGYVRSEKGVHRLVRISPFDSNAKRHTSFASVEVTPMITEDIAIEIRPEDIKIDTYRASGAGGQHVNKTDSAVRVTHLESKIVCCCQSQRSQLQNRETCMKMLKSKLYEREVAEREASIKLIQGDKSDNAWGSQIRNYVFQPYTLVKDSRTGFEVGNVQGMMDGDLLDGFVAAYLKEFG